MVDHVKNSVRSLRLRDEYLLSNRTVMQMHMPNVYECFQKVQNSLTEAMQNNKGNDRRLSTEGFSMCM